jgi:hypothetical protein
LTTDIYTKTFVPIPYLVLTKVANEMKNMAQKSIPIAIGMLDFQCGR